MGITKQIQSHTNHRGYHILNLHYKGKIYPCQIHRLVAEAFIPNPENKPEVNHKDGNKDHNYESNLEWNTAKENTKHAVDNDLIKSCENSVQSLYTNEQIKQVCELFVENKKSCTEISNVTKVKLDTVRDVLRHKTWKKISSQYDFSHYNVKDKTGAKGEKNSLSKISENTVHNICKDIESNKLSLKNIAKKYDTTYRTIQHIYGKETWRFISDHYDFSKYKREDHLGEKVFCSTTIEKISMEKDHRE